MTNSIDFHVINMDSRYAIFHPESMSLFSVTEHSGKILKCFEESRELKDIASDLRITEDNAKEELCELNKKIRYIPCKDLELVGNEPQSICMIISQDCNLRCEYCYADHGEYHKTKQLMNFTTAKLCIEKLFKNAVHDKYFILFFGGEPLLNFSLMNEIEAYRIGKELKIDYYIVTNGTILTDPIKDFFNTHISSAMISLDGMKESNDKLRHGNVKSVHDQVITTIQELNKSRTYPIAVKSIITKENFNKIEEISDYIGSLGVDSLMITPIHFVGKENRLNMDDCQFNTYLDGISAVLRKNINLLATNGNFFYTSAIDILRQLATKRIKIRQCSAGIKYVAISADGDVYPCNGCIGMNEFYMGNVYDEDFPGDRYYTIKQLFKDNTIHASNECRTCWARYICGGDCAINSYMNNGDLSIPSERHCIMMKEIIETLLLEIAYIFKDTTKRQKILNKLSMVSDSYKLRSKHGE